VLAYKNMYKAIAAASMSMFGKARKAAEEMDVSVLRTVATFLISGQMVEFTIKETEIQT
jgi:hypothetical protein